MKFISKPSRIALLSLPLLTLSIHHACAETFEEWGKRALNIQANIDRDARFSETTWIGSHNSMANNDDDNYIDPNQPMSLTAQLNAGVRELVLDLHWDSDAVRLCHNNVTKYGECIDGITGNRKLAYGLDDIKAWIENGHRDQVILLKLEIGADVKNRPSKLENLIEGHIGAYHYRPTQVANYRDYNSAYNCTYLEPSTLTKAKVLAAGKNIVIYYAGNCIEDGTLNNNLFYGGSNIRDTRSLDEVKNFTSANFDMSRMFDSATKKELLSSTSSVKIRPSTVAAYMDAGLNIFEMYGFGATGSDWYKNGERPPASSDLVWSWKAYEPSNAGACAKLDSGYNRFFAADCSLTFYAACRKLVSANGYRLYGDWYFTSKKVKFSEAEAQCIADTGGNAFFATPRNKIELNALVSARNNANIGAADLWMNYTKSSGTWKADIGEADSAMQTYCNNGGTGAICQDNRLASFLNLVQ